MNDLQDVIRQLEELKTGTLAKAQRKALRAVGELVQAALVEASPVSVEPNPGGLLQPGELKASWVARVHIATDESRLNSDISNVVIKPKGAAEPVAGWVEYGHKSGSKHTPAHPFIRPVYDAIQSQAEELYGSVMAEVMTKAVAAQTPSED